METKDRCHGTYVNDRYLRNAVNAVETETKDRCYGTDVDNRCLGNEVNGHEN